MKGYLILAILLMTACSPVEVQPVIHDCPAIVDYTQGDLTQAAAELTTMQDANHRPRYPMVNRFMADYGRERAALKACQVLPVSNGSSKSE